MPRPTNTFTHLANVPVHYDRFPNPRYGYGTRGQPRTWHATPGFETALNACFAELWQACPLGMPEVITTAGVYVDKPGVHGVGRALDLDCLFWADTSLIALHYPQMRAFYLGVEAILRKHFGTVLNYEYNSAHHDHWHIEDTTEVGLSMRRRSQVLYLQMALTFLFDHPVAVDGQIGPQTNRASRELLIDLNLASPASVATDAKLHQRLSQVSGALFDACAQRGFAGLVPQPVYTPLKLLEQVYTAITEELADSAARKRIETALTAFVAHDDTDAWLQKYRCQ